MKTSMADEPLIIPTFTFDAFRKNHLAVTSHFVGSGNTSTAVDAELVEKTSAVLMSQLKDQGIEIDTPYESFFTDGAPPEISPRKS